MPPLFPYAYSFTYPYTPHPPAVGACLIICEYVYGFSAAEIEFIDTLLVLS